MKPRIIKLDGNSSGSGITVIADVFDDKFSNANCEGDEGQEYEGGMDGMDGEFSEFSFGSARRNARIARRRARRKARRDKRRHKRFCHKHPDDPACADPSDTSADSPANAEVVNPDATATPVNSASDSAVADAQNPNSQTDLSAAWGGDKGSSDSRAPSQGDQGNNDAAWDGGSEGDDAVDTSGGDDGQDVGGNEAMGSDGGDNGPAPRRKKKHHKKQRQQQPQDDGSDDSDGSQDPDVGDDNLDMSPNDESEENMDSSQFDGDLSFSDRGGEDNIDLFSSEMTSNANGQSRPGGLRRMPKKKMKKGSHKGRRPVRYTTGVPKDNLRTPMIVKKGAVTVVHNALKPRIAKNYISVPAAQSDFSGIGELPRKDYDGVLTGLRGIDASADFDAPPTRTYFINAEGEKVYPNPADKYVPIIATTLFVGALAAVAFSLKKLLK